MKKRKVAIVNMVEFGSTGRIMLQIAEEARKSGHDVKTYSPVLYFKKKSNTPNIIPGHTYFGTRLSAFVHTCLGMVFGINGLLSVRATKKLVRELKRFAPDVVHLHNLHQFCLNLPILFRYLKASDVNVVWTLHDCWAFTGHCPYFDMVGCDKWKSKCHKCPQLKIYPKSYIDTSKLMFGLKKKWFTGLENLWIVTPSKWLADLTKESFLKKFPVQVINNGIDLSVFKPTKSDFRKCHNLDGKFVLLGVAFGWNKRKGLDVFIELARRLHEKFAIVLVGTNEEVDKQLPDNIVSIHRTHSKSELAEIYSSADLFINPTREENYPTVNMEAISCGLPVITFNTGGSPEIPGPLCGSVVEKDDIDAMEQEILRVFRENTFSKHDCFDKSRDFDKNDRFKEYVALYESFR